MQPILTTTQWLMLPQYTRDQLVKIFNLRRSTGAQIMDSRVISDGFTHEDLQRINVGTMQAHLGSEETDFFALFNNVLASIPKEEVPRNPGQAPRQEVRITFDHDGRATARVVDSVEAKDLTNNENKQDANVETKEVEKESDPAPESKPAKPKAKNKGGAHKGAGGEEGDGSQA